MDNFYDNDSIKFISAPALPSELSGECVIDEKAKRDLKIDVFGKRIGKLTIFYILFIGVLVFTSYDQYFVYDLFYKLFSVFGDAGIDAFYALKMQYISMQIRNIILFFPLFFYYLTEKNVMKNTVKQKKLKLSRVPAAFIFVFGMLFILNIVLSIISSSLYGSESNEIQLPPDAAGIVFTFVSSAIVPALIEEFFFRHVILRSLLPYNKLFAIFCSSLLFSLAHFPIDQKIFAMFFGIMVGFIYVKTESIFPGIALHMLNNAFSALQTYSSSFLSESVNNVIAYVMIIFIYLSLFIGIYYIFNYKASPFYIKDKVFSDTVLSKSELTGKLLQTRAVIFFFAAYLVVSLVIFQ